MVKNPAAKAGDIREAASIPESGRSPPIFLPGESHGQRSLVGYVRRAEDRCWDLARTACTQSLLLRLLSSPLLNGGIITRAYGVLVRTEDMLLSVQR